jgi:hypothetical protein
MDRQWYQQEAQKLYPIDKDFDRTQISTQANKEADVSKGSAAGAWVECWVWIPDPPPKEKTDGE